MIFIRNSFFTVFISLLQPRARSRGEEQSTVRYDGKYENHADLFLSFLHFCLYNTQYTR
jgi:hypothetical protein